MSARAFVAAAGLAACLVALAGRADACSCVQPTVSANEPAGRCMPVCATSPEKGEITPRCLQD